MSDKKLTKAHEGEPMPNTNNLVLDLKFFISRVYNLRRNVISRNIELNGIPVDDKVINSIFINCKTNYPKASKDLVRSILFSDFTKDYNPFAEILNHYVENPPKVKKGYIDDLISTIETDTPNANLFIKKWLVALIASINHKHSPLVLVLTGGQNTGKTEWFRRLLPECLRSYYSESKLDAGKDDEILMTKKLIIMDDEMGGKSKMEQKKLKEITSKQTFTIRAPYGSVHEDLTRLAMLAGTSNDDELLNDPTGNRRILPTRVLSIDHKKYNAINKDLVFYEAFLLYESGFNYNLTKEEIALLAESSDSFKQSSPEEELVIKYFGHPEDEAHQQSPVSKLTNSEILSIIQSRSNIKISQTKLGLVLKNIGFKQEHIPAFEGKKTTKRVYNVVSL